MKWCVTDAQMTAIRAEIHDGLVTLFVESATQRQAAMQAELARLREDRAAELARVVDPSAAFVAHLKAEVEFWRIQYAYQRQRADVSIDQRLVERGLGPATLPPRPITTDAATDTNPFLDELMKNADFAAMGTADGVER